MRLWSIHPKYLDQKGLGGLWREGLGARVSLKGHLDGIKVGYKNHPQLERFKVCNNPMGMLDQYLHVVADDATRRKYNYNRSKLDMPSEGKIKVTTGQIDYEIKHLLKKLKERDPEKYDILRSEKSVILHPMFELIEGEIEKWEIL